MIIEIGRDKTDTGYVVQYLNTHTQETEIVHEEKVEIPE